MPAQKMRPVAGAGAVLLVEDAELGLAEGQHRLEALDLVALLADLVLQALGLLLPGWSRSALERLVDGRLEVGDLLLDRARLVGLALLELVVDPLGLGGDDLAQAGAVASLPPLSPAATMTSPVGSKAIGLGGLALAERGQPRLDGLGRCRRSPRSAPPAGPRARPSCAASVDVELVLSCG